VSWRLLPFRKAPAALNMAIDEAIAEAVRSGAAAPTVRFYGWSPSAVSIGCFQSIDDTVDVEECRRQGVDVVRRRTGGGAVYHDSEGEITYSVIAPEAVMGTDIPSSYRQVCGWIMDAISMIGLEPAYAPINDVLVGGRKVSGCAQTRREGVFLQHGTVLYDLDTGKMFSLLRVSREKISDKGLASPEQRVTSIKALSNVSRDELLAALERSFCRGKECAEAPLSKEEYSRARELAAERYGNDGWTFSR
jgi:lipoate-protein ligase A